MLRLILLLSLGFLVNSCGEEEEESLGKINIRLDLYSGLQNASTDSSVTTVNWACVVLSASETACTYYYNGVAQVDGSISSDAASAGPGTEEFTFVESGTTIEGLEGGLHSYTTSFSEYRNGSTFGTPTSTSGELDLYANKGEDVNWAIGFGTKGVPTMNNF